MASDAKWTEVQAAVEAVETSLVAALEAGDAPAVAGFYAEDGVLLLPGRAPLAGRAAIEEHFRTVFRSWTMKMESDTADIAVDGDLAALRGTVVQRVRRKRFPRLGLSVRLRHLLVLRRDASGAWRVAWDTVQKAER